MSRDYSLRSKRQIYQIYIKGHMGKWGQGWFPQMKSHTIPDEQGLPITLLEGSVEDQSALIGLIRQIHNLGLTMLSLKLKDFHPVAKGGVEVL